MDKNLIDTLAKVIIAAGWADKKLELEEINSLKDLLFEFRHAMADVGISEDFVRSTGDSGITSGEWAKFQMYTESPVDSAERERLVDELREAVWSEEDKDFVISVLQKMVEADGKVTEDEKVVLNGIKERIAAVDTGIFGDLGRLVRGAVQRRSEAVGNAPDREKYFEEFLKNKVYYEVRRRLDLGEANLEIPDEDLRKLSMAGGLMARVAQVDNIILEKETDKLTSILQSNWNLSHEAATFVIQVALSEANKDFDYLRMSREFLALTAPDERTNLLDVLFAVANADGKISNEELKEISRIADYLLMSRNRVMEARSKFTQ